MIILYSVSWGSLELSCKQTFYRALIESAPSHHSPSVCAAQTWKARFAGCYVEPSNSTQKVVCYTHVAYWLFSQDIGPFEFPSFFTIQLSREHQVRNKFLKSVYSIMISVRVAKLQCPIVLFIIYLFTSSGMMMTKTFWSCVSALKLKASSH